MTGSNGHEPEPEYRPWYWLCPNGHWTETSPGRETTDGCCPHCPKGRPCRAPVIRVDAAGKKMGARAKTKTKTRRE